MGKYNENNRHFNVEDFQHPYDKRCVDAVTKIPGFEKVLEFISKYSIEKQNKFVNDASHMKITREMSPKIFEMMDEAADMFGVDKLPDVYMVRMYDMFIMLQGIEYPNIICSSEWLKAADDEELWCVITAMMAQVNAKHGTIKFVEYILPYLKGVLPFGIDKALDLALKDWFRNRIYTDDRATLLATGSFEKAAKHILMGEASDEVLESLKLGEPDNEYYKQAKEFLQQKDIGAIHHKLNMLSSKKQWCASRYMELYNWYYSGEYDEVLERSEQ